MARAAATFGVPRFDLRGFLTRNVPLKLAAVGIAVVAWLVQSQRDVEVQRTLAFEGSVPVERANAPEGYVLRGSLGAVEVTVRGPQGDLRDLAVSSFRAEADLSQYDLGRVGELQELRVRVSVAKERLSIVDVRPSVVAAKLVAVETKKMTVQVRFQNQPPAGFRSEQPAVSPAEVSVRGPADALREVVSVVVAVRFSDAPNDVHVTPRALPVDAAGHEVPDVEATPQNVAVSAGVRAATPTRTVGVIPVLRGQPAPGYWVASAVADPAVVTVLGDPTALDRVERVETAPIEVAGTSADRVVRAALVLPAGTSLARDADAVQVTISVRALAGTRLFPLVPVQPLGLRSDLVAEVEPAGVDVLLSGTLPVLQAVGPEQVTASLDLSGKGPGTYQLDAFVRAPSGTTASLPNGARITVAVRSR